MRNAIRRGPSSPGARQLPLIGPVLVVGFVSGFDLTGIPGDWLDACALGVTGDWRLEVAYRSTTCAMASSVVRNDVSNPVSYVGDDPEIGSTMMQGVDLTPTGHTSANLFAYDAPANPTLGSGAVVLVGGNALVTVRPVAGPVAQFFPMVPSDPGIAGISIDTQALHVGGVSPFALSSSVDFTAGYRAAVAPGGGTVTACCGL